MIDATSAHLALLSDGDQPSDGEMSGALLGHDLRAALVELRNSLYLLQEAGVPPHLQEPLDRCRVVSETLSRMIDQSLQISLGQDPATTARLDDVVTKTYLATLRLRWTGLCAETGHDFALNVVGALPDCVIIDRTALDRIMANLISNAQAHTPPGAISVTFKASGDDQLLILVEDEGPGFPKEHLPTIESQFALPLGARRPGGGLGLHSVKALVAAMGGRCNARNKATGGAEVGVCLPLPKACCAATLEETVELAPLPDLRGMGILLVDDSATSRELVSLLAHKLNADIRAVSDGHAALAALQEPDFHPDLVILDDEMPGATGRDVLRAMRAGLPNRQDLPVLALTSHIDKNAIDALYAAGAQEVLSKPVVCPVDLGRAIERSLGRTMDARAQPIPNITPPPSPEEFDLSVLEHLARIAGPEASAELFQKMEEDLLAAKEGLAAASVAGDLAAIRAHSHVIIALAGTAGAGKLHDDAVTLNGMAHANDPLERIIALAERLDGTIGRLAAAVRAMAATPIGAAGP